MTDSHTGVILAALAKATAQAPIGEAALREASTLTARQFAAGVQTLLGERRICTYRQIKGDLDHNVYWPTGIVTPVIGYRVQAAAGRKPPTRPANIAQPAAPAKPASKPSKEKKETPMKEKKETQGDRIAALVAKHGPITTHALADLAKVAAKSMDSYLALHRADGRIVERQGYDEDRARVLKHYMTPAQAEVWDEKVNRAKKDTAAPTAPATQEIPEFMKKKIGPAGGDAGGILLGLLGVATVDEAKKLIEERRQRDHQLRNDLAGTRMVLENVARKLQVDQLEEVPAALDDLIHALSTRAATAQASGGALAILLIDSTDQIELEALDTDDTIEANSRAISAVQAGHAERALLVRIQGEAARTVAWKVV